MIRVFFASLPVGRQVSAFARNMKKYEKINNNNININNKRKHVCAAGSGRG